MNTEHDPHGRAGRSRLEQFDADMKVFYIVLALVGAMVVVAIGVPLVATVVAFVATVFG